jgi:hypothetical protein
MMQQSFTHEVGEDPLPRRRVRISGPIYDDSNVPFLRIEFEDGNAELIPTSEMRLFRALQQQQVGIKYVRREPNSKRMSRKH